jgi:uncharacterized protein (TIGR00369 family)
MIRPRDESFRNVFLVRSAHLNHHGHLFGGDLMAEIDTTAYCLLRQEYGQKVFVTRAAEISFERPARIGDAVVLRAEIVHVGTTSVQAEVIGEVDHTPICRAIMTYVNLGVDGQKAPL